MQREKLIENLNNNFKKTNYELSANECINEAKALNDMITLRDLAKDCKTKDDYFEFIKKTLPLKIENTDDGIILYLGKKECSCPYAKNLTKNKDKLCECTRLHEKKTWSIFFDKDIDIELVETLNRKGKDCVIKIKNI